MRALATFDLSYFINCLDAHRREKGLCWLEVANQSGVHLFTICQMQETGKNPTLDEFVALVVWSGLDANSFITRKKTHSETI